jgi:hypothetical protein
MSNQHIEALQAARKKLIEDRRATVERFVKDDPASSQRARDGLLDVQKVIAAIDDALEDEKNLAKRRPRIA